MLVPVTVYLDSQDFSRFSSSHSEYAKYAQVRRELVDLKQRGIARFVFSDVHVWEAMPSDVKTGATGLERIRTIAEFCGGEHLPSASTVVEHELRSLTCGCKEAMWPEWYPHFELERPDRGRIACELVLETARNRKQRRMLRKAMQSPPDAHIVGSMVDEILSKYPFLRGGRRMLRSYFSHEAEWDAVEQSVRSGLRDIVGFSEWLVANWAYGQRFVAGLREGNQTVQCALVQLFDNMRTLFEQNRMTDSGATRPLATIYGEQRQRVLASFVDKCSEKVLGNSKPRRIEGGPVDPTAAPSLLTALQFITDVAYRSCLPKQPRNPYKQAGSDFADALHVLFASTVDVFRADRFTCDLLRRQRHALRARLCPALLELPAVIGEITSSAT